MILFLMMASENESWDECSLALLILHIIWSKTQMIKVWKKNVKFTLRHMLVHTSSKKSLRTPNSAPISTKKFWMPRFLSSAKPGRMSPRFRSKSLTLTPWLCNNSTNWCASKEPKKGHWREWTQYVYFKFRKKGKVTQFFNDYWIIFKSGSLPNERSKENTSKCWFLS